jgi:hypothetical protein
MINEIMSDAGIAIERRRPLISGLRRARGALLRSQKAEVRRQKSRIQEFKKILGAGGN